MPDFNDRIFSSRGKRTGLAPYESPHVIGHPELLYVKDVGTVFNEPETRTLFALVMSDDERKAIGGLLLKIAGWYDKDNTPGINADMVDFAGDIGAKLVSGTPLVFNPSTTDLDSSGDQQRHIAITPSASTPGAFDVALFEQLYNAVQHYHSPAHLPSPLTSAWRGMFASTEENPEGTPNPQLWLFETLDGTTFNWINIPQKGDTGATGAAGSTGATGATGATGPAGTNGTNGINGTNGTDGTNGTNGTNGVSPSLGTITVNLLTAGSSASGSIDPDPIILHQYNITINIPQAANGTNGTNGTNGINGLDGVLATPLQPQIGDSVLHFWLPVVPGMAAAPWKIFEGFTVEVVNSWGLWGAHSPPSGDLLGDYLGNQTSASGYTKIISTLPETHIIATLRDDTGSTVNLGSDANFDPTTAFVMPQDAYLILNMNVEGTSSVSPIGLLLVELQITPLASDITISMVDGTVDNANINIGDTFTITPSDFSTPNLYAQFVASFSRKCTVKWVSGDVLERAGGGSDFCWNVSGAPNCEGTGDSYYLDTTTSSGSPATSVNAHQGEQHQANYMSSTCGQTSGAFVLKLISVP